MKKSQLVFTTIVVAVRKEVIGELHSVELERKIRLPDPTKAMEGVWKLLRRTRQQLNTTGTKAAGLSASAGEGLMAKKQAKLHAERQKSRGAQNALRMTLR